MAYTAAACESILDVATAINFYGIYTQTTYDMANDSILRGLLRPRPNRQLPLCRHCHSLPLQQPLMQYQLHTLYLLQLHL